MDQPSRHQPATPLPKIVAGWAIPVIMVAMFVLPFTVFKDVNTVWGAFTVYIVGTLAVIGLSAYLTRDWR